MKKLLTVITSILMVFILASCGGFSPLENNTPSQQDQTSLPDNNISTMPTPYVDTGPVDGDLLYATIFTGLLYADLREPNVDPNEPFGYMSGIQLLFMGDTQNYPLPIIDEFVFYIDGVSQSYHIDAAQYHITDAFSEYDFPFSEGENGRDTMYYYFIDTQKIEKSGRYWFEMIVNGVIIRSNTLVINDDRTSEFLDDYETQLPRANLLKTDSLLSNEPNPAGNFQYEYSSEHGGIEITGYLSTNPIVHFPEEIEGQPVVSIGSKAFFGNRVLETVIIPDSVIYIGEGAFYDCTAITSVTLGKSIRRIESGAFNNTAITNIILPNGITYIGSSAFANSNLTSVVVPDSVTESGRDVFNNTPLVSITLPHSTTIPKNGNPPTVAPPMENHRGDEGYFYVVSDDYIVTMNEFGTDQSYMLYNIVDGKIVSICSKGVINDIQTALNGHFIDNITTARLIDNVRYNVEPSASGTDFHGMTKTALLNWWISFPENLPQYVYLSIEP
ncbi:MAG: leucine-rich repeat protein [Oscillospiraceae bacterium]|nr:leucine-rich repeat protein [Oscillospiraceae bacterium]